MPGAPHTLMRALTPLRFPVRPLLITISTVLLAGAVLAGTPLQNTDRSHVLRGRVVDAVTNAPLAFANVFLAGTTRGTSTDTLGRYVLAGIPRGSFDVVASLVGYELNAEHERFGTADTILLDFRLRARIIQVEEVQATGASRNDWREELSRFRDQFLGTDDIAADCVFLNPGVIEFERTGGPDILTARSDSTIRIDNKALGYRLQIHLEEFHWSERGGGLLTRQFVLFSPLRAENNGQASRWEETRAQAYRGSKIHFLRSLFAGTSRPEGFTVYHGTVEELRRGRGHYQPPDAPEFFQHVGPDLARLSFPACARVDYRSSGSSGSSIITLQGGDVMFDASGSVLDPHYITVLDNGAWARERVSRLLPIDYQPPAPAAR